MYVNLSNGVKEQGVRHQSITTKKKERKKILYKSASLPQISKKKKEKKIKYMHIANSFVVLSEEEICKIKIKPEEKQEKKVQRK